MDWLPACRFIFLLVCQIAKQLFVCYEMLHLFPLLPMPRGSCLQSYHKLILQF